MAHCKVRTDSKFHVRNLNKTTSFQGLGFKNEPTAMSERQEA